MSATTGHELCTTNSWFFAVNPLIHGTDQRQAHPLYRAQLAIAKIVGPKVGLSIN